MKKLITKLRELSYEERTNLMTTLSMLLNFFWSVFKIIFGFVTHAFLFVVSGVFTFLIGTCKKGCLYSLKGKSKKAEKEVYILTGIIFIIASLTYLLYMCRFFFLDDAATFGKIEAIIIASFSFFSLGISIVGLCKAKNKHPLYKVIKMINFETGLTDIALTQIALLSMNSAMNVNIYNGVFGVIIGAIGIVLGIYMLLTAQRNFEKLIIE